MENKYLFSANKERLADEPITNQRDVFQNHYAELCTVLEVEEVVPRIVPDLVARRVLTFQEEEEVLSQPTSLSKARALLSPIRKALFEGINQPFHEFLSIAKSSRHKECADLAGRICDDLELDSNEFGAVSREYMYTYNAIFLYKCRVGYTVSLSHTVHVW